MKRKVLLRVDGSKDIGLGHIVRCEALAEMIISEFQVNFVYKEMPEETVASFISKGYQLTKIEDESQFFQILKGNEIVVLDHYGLDSSYQYMVKCKGCKLVCIDDIHDKVFYADLIINHAPNVNKKFYSAQSYTRFALGPDYSLLRSRFLAQAKNQRKIVNIKSVFVSFGGADPKNLTLEVLKCICSLKKITINVVTGASYAYVDTLSKLIVGHSQVSFYHNINEEKILDLMKSSDLAIVPTSGIFFEALACGCNIITSYYVDNQRKIFDGFKKLNAAYFIDDFSSFNRGFLNEYISNYKMKNFQNPIDGYSGDRIKNLMKAL